MGPRAAGALVLLSLVIIVPGGAAPAVPAAAPSTPPFDGRTAFRVLGADEGLSNLTVECLLQDHEGFLWAGTQDGLFRFDGRRFRRFGRAEGLPSTRVNALHETADHRLFVGTRGGLARRDGERFHAYTAAEGMPETTVHDQGIASNAQGTVYVGSMAGGHVGRGDRFDTGLFGPSDPPSSVTALHVDASGALFFARGGVLLRHAGERTEDFGTPRGLPSGERIDQSVTDGAGRLWVRTVSALYVLEKGAAAFRREDKGVPAAVDSGRLALDHAGNLLVPTSGGLARRDGAAFRILGKREGLPTDTALSALEDHEGALWIGLAGEGLAQRLGNGAFASWGQADGLPHDVVWAVTRDASPARALWVGTQDGLARLDPASGATRIWREADGLAGNSVFALAAAPDGSVWAGSVPGGLTHLGADGRVQRMLAEGSTPATFPVVSLFLQRSGVLWAGSRAGAFRLAPGDALPVPASPAGAASGSDAVYAFAEDASGLLLAGGRQGLQVLAGAPPRRFGKKDGLADDFVSSLVSTGDGWFVLRYREPLGVARVRVDDGRLRVEPIAREGASESVLFLGRDSLGALWIGTDRGVEVLEPGLRARRQYRRADGLVSEDTDQNAFFAEADGQVWFGTSRGLVRYRPQPVHESAPPRVVVTGLRSSRNTFDASAEPVLARDERSLTVTWAGLTFSDPARVRFRYRLVGLDEAWTETASDEARFTALPTGTYRFEVLGVSASGRESAAPAVVRFSVRRAWWESALARAAAGLFAALLVYAAVKTRTRALVLDRARLEDAVARRSAELAAANAELREASLTDPLTRIRNRRFVSATIPEEVSRVLRAHAQGAASGDPVRNRDLIFYVVDADHFKRVNDTLGHQAGDRVLLEMAARLVSVARQADLVVRWGGEEFLVAARDTDRALAATLAQRILDVVGQTAFDVGDGKQVHCTCSVGWAAFPWIASQQEAVTWEDVVDAADRALYVAKAEGRNRGVGVVPRGDATEIAGRPSRWWKGELAALEGTLVDLIRVAGSPPIA